MKIEVGQFGRFWDGVNRPASKHEYVYGYLTEIVKDDGGPIYGDFYEADNMDRFNNFEPASAPPQWSKKKRRVIADRAKLVRILLDMGFVPNSDGAWVSDTIYGIVFYAEMWAFCGEFVSPDGVHPSGYAFMKEWLEPYED